MSRSGRPNVVAWLRGAAFRLLAAVELPAFLFCALRLAMPFASLSDHGQPTTRPAHEPNHHFRVISHGLIPSTYCKTAVPAVMADGLPVRQSDGLVPWRACRFIRHARGMSALTGGTPVLRLEFERAVFGIDMDGLAFADFAFEDVDAERVEDFFLNRTLERARTVNRVVTFARNQFFG